MHGFKEWLEIWFPLDATDKINSQDSPPQRTANNDYIVYHGTNMTNARKIFRTRTILHDNLGVVGITTHPSRADVFGAMKAGRNNPSVVLRIVVDRAWLDAQRITREVGGSGRDQFLIDVPEIPSSAIKDIQLARVYGTPLKQGTLEYPTTGAT